MDDKQVLASAAAAGASMAFGLYLMHGVPRPISRLLGKNNGKSSRAARTCVAGADQSASLDTNITYAVLPNRLKGYLHAAFRSTGGSSERRA